MSEIGEKVIERVARASRRYVEGSLGRAGHSTVWRIHDSENDLAEVASFATRVERDGAMRLMNTRAALAEFMAAAREPEMIEKLAMAVQCYHRTADDARYVLDALAGELFNV